MSSQVVIPGWVPGAAGVRRRDDDPLAVVEVDDRVSTRCATLRALRLEYCRRKHQRACDTSPSDAQQ